jgi:hypothetical protein
LLSCIGQQLNPDYRKALLANLSRLDRMVTEADAILARPGDAEAYAWAEE